MHARTALALLAAGMAAAASNEEAARAILAKRCYSCHTGGGGGDLRLDGRAAILRGGKSGPAIIPGDALGSRLYLAVSRAGGGVRAMPPGAPLSNEEVEAIARWIDEGAPWSSPAQHWSFLPLRPAPADASIDSLVEAALRAKGLAPNPTADKRTLIRRLYFDLIGLPPDEREFAEAFHDSSSGWLANLVTKLLASPHFGEKWARHWLDVARYGEDDYSGTAVIPYSNAWRYRDWVVNAMNRGLPYDRFLMAQLAGDLMGDESLVAGTGLLGLGPWYYGIAQPAQSRADERHDRVDVVTRGMLGVTVACARCHDHKYDPFTQQDYYALAGVFASTAYKEYPLVPEAEVAKWTAQKKELERAEKELNKFLDAQSTRLAERYAPRIAAYMLAAVTRNPVTGLEPKVLARWRAYLLKREDAHPFLNRWFDGAHTQEEAERFQRLILDVATEKKAVDEENRKAIEAANAAAPKVERTIVLPGGYRSEEDFNPGAYIPSKSLDRDRFVAYNRTFGERDSPLKFDRKLTAEMLDGSARQEYESLKANFEKLKKALPPQYPYVAGAGEFDPMDLRLNIRGNPESLGEVVPRRFPLVLTGGTPVLFNQGSGRLQLAKAVAHHPLAARVAANRAWLALFGQGLVRTPSNFGRAGDRPAMPDLLEMLASRLVESKYSIKALIREIVLSDAYQRSSARNEAAGKSDPDNRYLWRQNRRRLSAEALLDAMLAASAELDRTTGGESKPLDSVFRRRTLYARTSRFQQDETLSLFDLPSASVTCEQRVVTNVPLQKLFYLNSDIVDLRAAVLAKRIERRGPAQGIEAAYMLLFQRLPNHRERALGVEFLRTRDRGRWKQYAQVLLSSNEFAYVD